MTQDISKLCEELRHAGYYLLPGKDRDAVEAAPDALERLQAEVEEWKSIAKGNDELMQLHKRNWHDAERNLTASQDRVARLEEALMPFAKMGEQIALFAEQSGFNPDTGVHTCTFADLQKARNALEQKT